MRIVAVQAFMPDFSSRLAFAGMRQKTGLTRLGRMIILRPWR